jgi:acetyl esterase/lipase
VEAMPIAGTGRIKVITVDYREAPESRFPAASEDLLAKFPPVLFVTATRDMAMSTAIYSHNQLAKAGVESELRVWDGLWHAFIVDDLPEAREASNVIVHFFDKHLGTKALKSSPPTWPARLRHSR